MYAITGITGQVGGQLARRLLDAGQPVRAVLRDPAKAAPWAARGCEVAIADVDDTDALAHAFEGCAGVFMLLPPTFDPSPGFAQARRAVASLHAALARARPARVVALSTVGAQATQPNLLAQLGLLEQALGTLALPVAFLRAAWFIENAAWDVAAARETGTIPAFLQPTARRIPMVATADVARLAAELLGERWDGVRVVELEGPRPLSPDDLAAAFARALGREVQARAVARESWAELFASQGMANPTPRMQMLDGFNAGWLCFEGRDLRRGATSVDAVVAELLAR